MTDKHELKKLIIAEDDEDILTIIQISLEEVPNLQLKLCRTGQEVIQEAINFIPDMIILDVMMPNMDGIATIKALQLIPLLANIPVVFMTAKAQVRDIEEYLKLGVLDVIIKPFDPLLLPEIISECWRKSIK